jgi:hypothetical protein
MDIEWISRKQAEQYWPRMNKMEGNEGSIEEILSSELLHDELNKILPAYTERVIVSVFVELILHMLYNQKDQYKALKDLTDSLWERSGLTKE